MDRQLKRRWRLILGRFADKPLPDELLSAKQRDQDEVMEKLYGMQLQKRGLRGSQKLDNSQIAVISWLDKADKLFPHRVKEKIQSHAVEEFGVTQLLKDKESLQQLTPSMVLLKQILSVRSELDKELLQEVKRIIRCVVEDLMKQIKPSFESAIQGRLNRHVRSVQPILANFDWKKTIRENLKYYDLDSDKIQVKNIYFNSRSKQFIPWRLILCIDQSGSMMDSIIYSAVIAGVLAKLPMIELKLVLFDTNVVDLSHLAHDPVEVLMSSQMCGGTHIKKAWEYCNTLTEQPSKTIVATVSDFDEGGSPLALISQAKDMMGAGVKMLGITAMNINSEPLYDSYMTEKLSAQGMDIASLSPDAFADWLARAMGI